jgi:hypothetical protein
LQWPLQYRGILHCNNGEFSVATLGIFILHETLQTMLFLSHSISTAVNTGKILVTKNPMAINWAQWMVFAKYSISQLKWILYKKPRLRDKYVQGFIDSEWTEIEDELESTWNEFSNNSIFVYE